MASGPPLGRQDSRRECGAHPAASALPRRGRGDRCNDTLDANCATLRHTSVSLAFPAQHSVSGVMTFLVNHDGVVYEKDLGSRTAAIARGMKQFNPEGTWNKLQSR